MQKIEHIPPQPAWLHDLAKALSVDVAELRQQPYSWLEGLRVLLGIKQ